MRQSASGCGPVYNGRPSSSACGGCVRHHYHRCGSASATPYLSVPGGRYLADGERKFWSNLPFQDDGGKVWNRRYFAMGVVSAKVLIPPDSAGRGGPLGGKIGSSRSRTELPLDAKTAH